MMDADVIVVGGGVIGTAIAWRAAVAGRTVTLIDPGTDDKASLVAAGMLGPVSESVFGEQDLLALNLHAIDRFPAFNAELEAASGQPTGLRTEGTLAVAYDSGDLAALDRLTEFRHSIGLKAERLDAQGVPSAGAVPRPVHPGRRPRHRRPVGRQPPLPGRPPNGGRRGWRPHGRRPGHRRRRPRPGPVPRSRPRRRLRRGRDGRAVRRARRRRGRLGHRPHRRRARPDPQGDPPGQGPDSAAAAPREPAAHHRPHRSRDRPGPRHLPGPARGRRARRRRHPGGARRPRHHRRRRPRPAPRRDDRGPRDQRAHPGRGERGPPAGHQRQRPDPRPRRPRQARSATPA